jgi:DNA polymerase eta
LHLHSGWKLSRSKQAPFPFVRDVTTDVVAAAGDKLWKELSDSTNGEVSITHVALAFGGIESGEANQQGIEGFLAKPESAGGDRRKRKGDDDEAFESQGEGPSTDIPSRDDVDSFICKRCKKRIKLPDSLKGPDVTDDAQQKSLKVLQMEHDDYHLAQDLSKAPEEISPTKHSGGSKSKKRKKSEPDGIAKFFIKK